MNITYNNPFFIGKKGDSCDGSFAWGRVCAVIEGLWMAAKVILIAFLGDASRFGYVRNSA